MLRHTFPFLIKDLIDGRAKRSVRNQPKPWLLNSYQAHKQTITAIQFIETNGGLLVTGSGDKSVRLWSISGQYFGTFGSPVPWTILPSLEPPGENFNFRIPPDLKRELSFTTLKVLKGGRTNRSVHRKLADKKHDIEDKKERELKEKYVYGKPLKEPILGKYFKLPPRSKPQPPPVLDKSLECVSILYEISHTYSYIQS